MKNLLRLAVLTAALAAIGAPSVLAGGMTFPKLDNAAVLKECGSCHLVYRPQMLPQRSWDAILKNLASHFGENATVTEPARTEIATYLTANAADAADKKQFARLLRGVKADVTPLRITEMPWWLRGEGHGKFKGASNCTSSRCHAGADKSGYFGE